MTTNDYHQHMDLIHDLVLQIDELGKDNVALSRQLDRANDEVARLSIEVSRLETLLMLGGGLIKSRVNTKAPSPSPRLQNRTVQSRSKKFIGIRKGVRVGANLLVQSRASMGAMIQKLKNKTTLKFRSHLPQIRLNQFKHHFQISHII